MTVKLLSDELGTEILANRPFQEIVETLKSFRDAGVSQEQVRQALEALRDRTDDETIDDRILEVLDVVTGFCNAEHTIWDQ